MEKVVRLRVGLLCVGLALKGVAVAFYYGTEKESSGGSVVLPGLGATNTLNPKPSLNPKP
jgi:hypothetical protein